MLMWGACHVVVTCKLKVDKKKIMKVKAGG